MKDDYDYLGECVECDKNLFEHNTMEFAGELYCEDCYFANEMDVGGYSPKFRNGPDGGTEWWTGNEWTKAT